MIDRLLAERPGVAPGRNFFLILKFEEKKF